LQCYRHLTTLHGCSHNKSNNAVNADWVQQHLTDSDDADVPSSWQQNLMTAGGAAVQHSACASIHGQLLRQAATADNLPHFKQQ